MATRKRKSAIELYWNGDTESRRKANNVLDKMGIPSDYRTQYIAEKDMKGRAGKFVKAAKKKVVDPTKGIGKRTMGRADASRRAAGKRPK
jgi:hypothetical protein